jgi:hypothetical protein
MAKLNVIFVGGNSWVDSVIEKITHGDVSHVAIQILGGTLESQGIPDKGDRYPGVHLHDLHKYDNNPYAKVYSVDIPDVLAATQKAEEVKGKFYSYLACFEGGTYDLFKIHLHPIIMKGINWCLSKLLRIPIDLDTGEWTMDCSETVTRILRAGGLLILPNIPADEVTPEDLEDALVSMGFIQGCNKQPYQI